MNISLPESLRDFVDEQVETGGYGTSSEYVRELIRRDQDRLGLRGLLLAGASSPRTYPVDDVYFDSLREKAKAARYKKLTPDQREAVIAFLKFVAKCRDSVAPMLRRHLPDTG